MNWATSMRVNDLSGSPHNQSLHQEIHFILLGADFWKGLWSTQNQSSITAIVKGIHITRPNQQSKKKEKKEKKAEHKEAGNI